MRRRYFLIYAKTFCLLAAAFCGTVCQQGFFRDIDSHNNHLRHLRAARSVETLRRQRDNSLAQQHVYEHRDVIRQSRDVPPPLNTAIASVATALPWMTALSVATPFTGPLTNQPVVTGLQTVVMGSLTNVATTPGVIAVSVAVTSAPPTSPVQPLAAPSSTTGASTSPTVTSSKTVASTTTTVITTTATTTTTKLTTTATTTNNGSSSSNITTSQNVETTTLPLTSSAVWSLETTIDGAQTTVSGNDNLGFVQTSLPLSTESIIGIVIGAAAYILLMAILCRIIVYCSRRRVRKVASVPVFPETPYDELDRYTLHSSDFSVHYIKDDDVNNDNDFTRIIVNTPPHATPATRNQHHRQSFQQRQFPWQRDYNEFVFTY